MPANTHTQRNAQRRRVSPFRRLCGFCVPFGIPENLSAVGVTEDKIPEMAVDAMKSGNIAVNPRSSQKRDIVELYHKAI